MNPQTQPPPPSEWEHDCSDAPMDDPQSQPLKAAGCSMADELDQLTVRTNS